MFRSSCSWVGVVRRPSLALARRGGAAVEPGRVHGIDGGIEDDGVHTTIAARSSDPNLALGSEFLPEQLTNNTNPPRD